MKTSQTQKVSSGKHICDATNQQRRKLCMERFFAWKMQCNLPWSRTFGKIVTMFCILKSMHDHLTFFEMRKESAQLVKMWTISSMYLSKLWAQKLMRKLKILAVNWKIA